MKLKKWQKRKLTYELIALSILLIGLVVFIRFMMAEINLAWIALIGAAIFFLGLCAFMHIRETKNTKYKKKYPDRTRN